MDDFYLCRNYYPTILVHCNDGIDFKNWGTLINYHTRKVQRRFYFIDFKKHVMAGKRDMSKCLCDPKTLVLYLGVLVLEILMFVKTMEGGLPLTISRSASDILMSSLYLFPSIWLAILLWYVLKNNTIFINTITINEAKNVGYKLVERIKAIWWKKTSR